MQGWIKLHRKFLKWEWYTDGNTFRIFLHLLLSANYEDTRWRGLELKRGQTIIGRKTLSETLGISERAVRTSLDHLKSTNEVTIKSTNKYSIVTIEKWEEYQSKEDEATIKSTSEVTSNRPATDQQPTTPKEDKKIRIEEDKNLYIKAYAEILNFKLSSFTDKRILKLKIFAGKFSLEKFCEGLVKVKQSNFLMQSSFCKWDWIINESNFIKIMEGNYENNKSNIDRNQPRSQTEQIAAGIARVAEKYGARDNKI